MRLVCFFAGLFFVLPCTDNFVKVDLRTVSFDIPPQEASFYLFFLYLLCWCPVRPVGIKWHHCDCLSLYATDLNQRLSDCVCGWRGVFPHPLPHLICGQRDQRALLDAAAGSDHPEERAGNQEPGRAAVGPRGDFAQHAGEQRLQRDYEEPQGGRGFINNERKAKGTVEWLCRANTILQPTAQVLYSISMHCNVMFLKVK